MQIVHLFKSFTKFLHGCGLYYSVLSETTSKTGSKTVNDKLYNYTLRWKKSEFIGAMVSEFHLFMKISNIIV